MAEATPCFHITGYVRTLPVAAAWTNGHLVADEELVGAANELVTSGYVFEAGDGRLVPANLTDPFSAVLTVIRCFDRITHAQIDLPVHENWGEVFDGQGKAFVFLGEGRVPGTVGDLQGSE